MIILIAIATFISTFIGGLLAIRFKDRLHLVLGFSAGAVLGVAFFDLLPEALELGGQFYDASIITAFIALGFFVYLLLDRVLFFHNHNHEDADNVGHCHLHDHQATKKGILGAGSLSLHSLLDGVAIGLAFQASLAIGIIVAVAVLVHDFSDGINTVGFILKNKGGKKTAYKWLAIDALAPVVGVFSTFFFTLPESMLGIVLAMFCGFFLYIGASDLIPESHHSHPRFLTTVMTFVGATVLFVAIKFAGV